MDKITVTFDQTMMCQSWSWTGWGDETYPKMAGRLGVINFPDFPIFPLDGRPGMGYIEITIGIILEGVIFSGFVSCHLSGAEMKPRGQFDTT